MAPGDTFFVQSPISRKYNFHAPYILLYHMKVSQYLSIDLASY